MRCFPLCARAGAGASSLIKLDVRNEVPDQVDSRSKASSGHGGEDVGGERWEREMR